MKKTLLTLALVAVAAASFAQGKVGFVNDSTRSFNFGAAGEILAADAAQAGQGITTSASAGSFSALLYAGSTAGSLTLQSSVPLVGTDLISAGRMRTKNVTLNSLPAGQVTQFQIILVNTSALVPTTIVGGIGKLAFNDQSTGMQYFGTSGLFTFTPGGSVTFPVIYGAGSTWASGPVVVSAVPEPSSMALAGLGAASLLIFRRRK